MNFLNVWKFLILIYIFVNHVGLIFKMQILNQVKKVSVRTGCGREIQPDTVLKKSVWRNNLAWIHKDRSFFRHLLLCSLKPQFALSKVCTPVLPRAFPTWEPITVVPQRLKRVNIPPSPNYWMGWDSWGKTILSMIFCCLI
jgi:hypothetical protein